MSEIKLLFKTVFVYVGAYRKASNAKLAVFVKVNYEPLRYPRHPDKLDCINHEKCVRLFRYFHWFLRKSIVKLENQNFFDHRRQLGRHRKNSGNFV